MSDKEARVIEELKRRVNEMRFGELTVSFVVHEGKIVGAEIKEQKIKLA